MHRSRIAIMCAAALIMPVLGACQPTPAATSTPTRTPSGAVLPPTATTAPAGSTPATSTNTGIVGPHEYPPNVNPLTGLVVADPAVLQRSPLAIKVSNNNPSRPQSGLSFADLVFEHYAEGGETRFTVIIYSQTPERVGSVRSGRLLDVELIPMFDAILSASGFSGGTLTRLSSKPWGSRHLSGPEVGAPSLVRIALEDVAVEDTQFAIPSALWTLATEKNINNPPDLTPGLAFSGTVPSGGTPASQIIFEYGLSWTKVEWQYDPASGKYLRTLGGESHMDRLNEQQLAFDNVLAVGANHVKADYVEDGFSGELSTEIQVWGDGPATLFRDGQRIEGHWSRLDPEQMLQFTDLNGNVLYLKPGNTWFQMLPLGFDKMFVTP
jgi:hypothetical protein